MVTLDVLPSFTGATSEAPSSPRISFSSDLFDESNFITICPNPQAEIREREAERARIARSLDFEFRSANKLTNMVTADELIYEGKLVPFWEIHAEKLEKITLKSDGADDRAEEIERVNKEESRITWFADEDPSPRPPKCTVLWKELLKLKKQRPSTLLSTSSSSSSSLSSRSSVEKDCMRSREKPSTKRIKKVERERGRDRLVRG